MADVEIRVKIDGVEYTQEQLKDLASGAKTAGKEMDNLGKETKKAGEEATIFGDIKKKFGDMKEGVLKVVRSFKTLKGAIAATGIGLLVVAIGTLVEYFRSSEEGSKKLQVAMTALKLIFADISEFAQAVGEKIAWAFENPMEAIKELGQAIVDNIVERFKSAIEVVGFLADAFMKLFEGEFEAAWESVKNAGEELVDVFTGVDNSVSKVTEAVGQFTDKVKTAIKTAEGMVNMQRALRAEQRALTQENAELNKTLEVNQKIAEDTTRSYDERKEALEKVGEAQIKLAENAARQAQIDKTLLEIQLAQTANYEEQQDIQDQLAEANARATEAQTALEIKKVEVSKITAELEQAELDRKRSIADQISALELATLEDARLKAQEELRIAEEQALAELDILKATEEEKQRVREAFGAMRAKLSQDQADNDYQTTVDSLSAIGDAFGEGTEMFKVFKSAETIMSTYSAAQKAYESAIAVPVIGPVLAPAAAAAAVASGLATLKQIQNTKIPEPPEMAFGGFVDGASHAGGGRMINAEGGEFVLNKYAMRQPGVAQIAQALNGVATPNNQTGSMAPIKTYVVATEVTSAQEANSKVEKLARL